MDLLIAKTPVNLIAHLRKAVTAHEAVRLGIATHAQREHARRLDARRKMAADAKLGIAARPNAET